MKLFAKVFLSTFLLLFLSASLIFAKDIPKPSGFVNDFANVLTEQQKTNLEAKLNNFEKQTTNEIAVMTTSSLENEDIDDYTVRVFESWKVGKEDKDNGVLFLAATDDRKMRIEVGYGVEPFITDGEAGEIIRNVIAPKFRSNDFAGGINDGVDAIIKQIENPINEPEDFSKVFKIIGFIFDNLEFLFFGFILIVYLFAYMARTTSFWLGGVVGGVIGILVGVFLASVAVGIVGSLLFGVIGLILDFLLSRVFKKMKEGGFKTDWTSTRGGFWGSRGSGSGFGGFGGGSSGGGGASGSW